LTIVDFPLPRLPALLFPAQPDTLSADRYAHPERLTQAKTHATAQRAQVVQYRMSVNTVLFKRRNAKSLLFIFLSSGEAAHRRN
jgi:hypothetical protein